MCVVVRTVILQQSWKQNTKDKNLPGISFMSAGALEHEDQTQGQAISVWTPLLINLHREDGREQVKSQDPNH